MRRKVARRVHGFEDRDDVFLEVRVRAWRRFDTFDPANSFRGWVGTILQRVCFEFYRKQATMAEVNPFPDEDGETIFDRLADPTPGPLDVLFAKDIDPALRRALAQIHPRGLKALFLKADGATYAEIGEAVGASPRLAGQLADIAAARTRRFLSNARS